MENNENLPKPTDQLTQVTQEEPGELQLESNFQELLKNLPPIRDKFSPGEELREIRKLPGDQRREALSIFKKKLVLQLRALAACRIFLEQIIESNPDVQKEELARWVEAFSVNYGFTDQQKQIIERLIEEYYKHRRRVLMLREQYPDDYELVYKLTGVSIERGAELKVSVGPMAIEIKTDASTAAKLFYRSNNPPKKYLEYEGFFCEPIDKNHFFI